MDWLILSLGPSSPTRLLYLRSRPGFCGGTRCGDAPFPGTGAPVPVVAIAGRPHGYALLTVDGQMQTFGPDQFLSTIRRVLPEAIGRALTTTP